MSAPLTRNGWIAVVLTLVAVVFLTTGCDRLLSGEDPDQGGLIDNNGSDAAVLIFSEQAGGDAVRVGGVGANSVEGLDGPCVMGLLSAKHSEDGPVLDTWEGGLCAGDYWTVPKGGLIQNNTDKTIAVKASGTHGIPVGAGGTGSLGAECAEAPITAASESFEAPTRLEPLCVGDVLVIEEP